MTTTRIDFHSNVSDQLDYACRLVRKALAADCKLVVLHQNPSQLAQFNELLWSFSPTDFLPHVTIDHALADKTPVLLTTELTESTEAHRDILLNLCHDVPSNFAQFNRLIEIVGQEEEATQAGRTRYRFYQQQGYQPTHINAK